MTQEVNVLMSERVLEDMSQLKKALDEEIELAVEELSKQVYKMARDFIKNVWYKDYTPKKYQRTYQLLESCILVDVKRNGVGYEAYVMLDSSKMHHTDKPAPKKTEEDIYRVADNSNFPMHGTNYPMQGVNSVRLWQPIIDELTEGDKLINDFANYLKSRGIDVAMVEGKSFETDYDYIDSGVSLDGGISF